MVLVQFLACQLLLRGLEAAVQFINEPEDVITNEGGVAMFNCSYSGTTVLPFWFINGIFYPIDRLPSSHSYVPQRLIVKDVQLSDNNTQYQCAFITIRSNIGTLYVIPEEKEVFLPTNTTLTTNSFHENKNLTTIKEETVITTTTLITTATSPSFLKIQNPLVISVISLVIILLLLFVIAITAMSLFIGKRYKEHHGIEHHGIEHHGIDEAQPEDQHIYEEISTKDKVETIQNTCYSKQPFSTTKNSMNTENPAYNIYPHHLHKQVNDDGSHSPATPPANIVNHHANLTTECIDSC